jgi:hypothetical protein
MRVERRMEVKTVVLGGLAHDKLQVRARERSDEGYLFFTSVFFYHVLLRVSLVKHFAYLGVCRVAASLVLISGISARGAW